MRNINYVEIVKRVWVEFGLAILICLGVNSPALSQPDTLWEKTYGGSSDDRGYSVQQTTDGGYIIAG
ncbi:MAG: hypothetical protein AB1422_05775, partial [bacterium]